MEWRNHHQFVILITTVHTIPISKIAEQSRATSTVLPSFFSLFLLLLLPIFLPPMRALEIVAHDRSSLAGDPRRRHMFMRRSLEGRGWKSPLRRRWRWRCLSRSDGAAAGPGQMILCSSSARTDRPPLLGARPPLASPPPPLGAAGPFRWRLQRNDPGWFVGEHRHVSFLLLPGTAAGLGPLPTAAAAAAAAAREGEQRAEAMFVVAVLCCAVLGLGWNDARRAGERWCPSRRWRAGRLLLLYARRETRRCDQRPWHRAKLQPCGYLSARSVIPSRVHVKETCY
jgi:hypothetical protein